MKAYLITSLVIYAMIVMYSFTVAGNWASIMYLGMLVWTVVELTKKP